MEIETEGKKIIFTDGRDRYTTISKSKAVEVFENWLYGERLPLPKIKLE